MYYLEKYELFPFVSGHISNDTEQDKDMSLPRRRFRNKAFESFRLSCLSKSFLDNFILKSYPSSLDFPPVHELLFISIKKVLYSAYLLASNISQRTRFLGALGHQDNVRQFLRYLIFFHRGQLALALYVKKDPCFQRLSSYFSLGGNP